MKRYFIQYIPEWGRPAPTPEEVFRTLGLDPSERPEFWSLLTRIANRTAGWILVAVPSDLGNTPLEAALLLRLCAANGISVRIVAPSIEVMADLPKQESVWVYRTTADYAELAKQLLLSQKGR